MYSARTPAKYALAAAFAVGGCTSYPAVETDASTPDSAVADAGVSAFGASVCGTCIEQGCAPALSSCGDEPDCVAYLQCLFACPVAKTGNVDPACAAGCPTGSTSAALQAENAVAACRTSGAGAVCAGCGGIDGGAAFAILNERCPDASVGTACNKYFDSHCCKPLDDCNSSSDCDAILSCYESCPADDLLLDAGPDAGFFPSCAEACIGQHVAGRVAFAALYFCVNELGSLATVCGGGPDPCTSCVNANCAQELLDLNEAPGGIGLFDCVTSCGTDAGPIDVATQVCQEDCQAEYPGASDALEVFLSCNVNTCAICGGTGGV